jgi:type IV pilus assembly protein PilN
MAHINLLPWREALRKEKKQEFLAITVFAALVTGVLFFFVHTHMNGLIDHQQARNQFLENEIKILDKKIAEIRDLEATKKALIDRMNIIQELQVARPGIVHLFDQMVTTLPTGLYLTSIGQKGAGLTVEGIAESNARVSAYMRNLEDSDWLKSPTLDVIETKDEGPTRVGEFKLNVQQTSPVEEARAEGTAQQGGQQ